MERGGEIVRKVTREIQRDGGDKREREREGGGGGGTTS